MKEIKFMSFDVFLNFEGIRIKGFMDEDLDKLLTLAHGDKYTIVRDKTFEDIRIIINEFLQYLNELKGDVKNENA